MIYLSRFQIVSIALFTAFLMMASASFAQESVVLSETGAGEFVVPANANRITVEVWGAGGSGGGPGRGGGGGGAYNIGTLAVSPGDRLPYHVGRGATSSSEAPGESSWFSTSGELSAGGGASARNTGNRLGGGGSNAGIYAGGSGASGATGFFGIPVRGGGGGSSAGSSANGTNANSGNGANAPFEGGDGGSEGGTAFLFFGGNGAPGESPGGGGGGAGVGFFSSATGGRGGDGRIRVSWSPLPLCSTIYSSDTGINAELAAGNRLDLDVFNPRIRTSWPGNNVIPDGAHVYPPREFAKNQNNINFTVDGRARVLVDGDLIINGNNFTMNENGDPANLLLIVDGNLEFNNNAKLNAIIYVTGDVEFNQNPIVVGAIASEGSITGIADSEVTFNEGVISRADFGGACISEDSEVVIDHFRIFHPSTALTCTPAQDIRVRACSNPECTTLFSEQVTVSLSPESGWLQGNTVSFVGETNELAFRSVSAGPATLGFLNSTVSAEGTPPLKCFADKGTTSGKCEIVFSESGLLLNAPDHTSAAEVQVSILGVKAGETDPGQCVPAFTGEKTIEFMASYQNPLSGMRVPESAGTSLSGGSLVLDFDGSGAASFPMRYRDVGSVLLQARYDGTGDEADLIIEGQDSFIARPDRFEVVVSGNPGTPDVTNENMFREAGEGFDVEVRALNALGEMTPNFGQESPREAVRLTVEEAPGIPLVNMPQLDGALELFGSFCTTPEPGKACGQFVWPEVGTFSLLPSLISGAYLGTENVEGRLLPYVGRFIPARFEIAIDPGRFSSTPLSTNRTSCTEERSWVYTGEPFGWDMAPEVVITPKNRNGVTVQNYAGTLFQRVGVDDVGFAPFPVEDEAATGVGGTPLDLEAALAPATLLPDTSGSLIYRFATDDEFRYPKTLNARVSGYTPEPVFSLEGLIDADGVTVLDPTENLPEVFKPVADFEIRYGRVALDNGYGPENLDLVIPLRAEVFGSGGFQLHQDEICWFYDLPKDTSVDFAASTFTSGQTGVVEVADVELSLEDGRPRKTAVEDYRLRLSAPAPSGAESVQARGIYVELDTGSDWLKDFWDADNQEALVNPYAWATFGVYRGNDRIIYWREVPTN